MKLFGGALDIACLLACLFSGGRAVTATPPAWQGKSTPGSRNRCTRRDGVPDLSERASRPERRQPPGTKSEKAPTFSPN